MNHAAVFILVETAARGSKNNDREAAIAVGKQFHVLVKRRAVPPDIVAAHSVRFLYGNARHGARPSRQTSKLQCVFGRAAKSAGGRPAAYPPQISFEISFNSERFDRLRSAGIFAWARAISGAVFAGWSKSI